MTHKVEVVYTKNQIGFRSSAIQELNMKKEIVKAKLIVDTKSGPIYEFDYTFPNGKPDK